jgi:hypothetical protein
MGTRHCTRLPMCQFPDVRSHDEPITVALATRSVSMKLSRKSIISPVGDSVELYHPSLKRFRVHHLCSPPFLSNQSPPITNVIPHIAAHSTDSCDNTPDCKIWHPWRSQPLSNKILSHLLMSSKDKYERIKSNLPQILGQITWCQGEMA